MSARRLLGRGNPTAGPELDAFWTRATALAERAQQEPGPGYEVLHVMPRRRLAMGSASVAARATVLLRSTVDSESRVPHSDGRFCSHEAPATS